MYLIHDVMQEANSRRILIEDLNGTLWKFTKNAFYYHRNVSLVNVFLH